MKASDMTDEQVVEHCRAQMQDTIDRIDWSAPTVAEMLDSTGKPIAARQVADADMTLIGTFHIRLPPAVFERYPVALREWLTLHYVHRHKDGNAYVLHFPKRLEMRQTGVVTITAFIEQPSN